MRDKNVKVAAELHLIEGYEYAELYLHIYYVEWGNAYLSTGTTQFLACFFALFLVRQEWPTIGGQAIHSRHTIVNKLLCL
jgi:hypothetical protein